MLSILAVLRVLLKDFQGFVEGVTERFCTGVEEMAKQSDRPVQYLASPQTNKEQLVQQQLLEQGIGPDGVIAVFKTVEVCQSYDIHRDREHKRLELRTASRKCLHFYVYRQ